MNIKKDWPKLLVFAIIFMLLGGYYDRFSVETRTFILPLLVFIAAAIVLGRIKQLQYEVRSSRVTALEVVAQTLSLADTEGNERISISVSSESATMALYDTERVSRASLELINGDPILRLVSKRGSAELTFDAEGTPSLSFRNEADEVTWSAP